MMKSTFGVFLLVFCLAACAACDRDDPPANPGNNDNNDGDAGVDAEPGVDADPDSAPEADPAPDMGPEPDMRCDEGLTLCGEDCVDLGVDVTNCGECGLACEGEAVNGAAQCAGGECGFACEEGFVDVNGDVGDGAEGDGCECSPTDPAAELCDGIDNDCDGDIDGEDADFDLSLCPDLSGADATACTAASCLYECQEGFVDVNSDLADGAEGDGCECAPTDPAAEVCDGIDNNCDGLTDGDDEGLDLSTCPDLDGAAPAGCALGACVYACEDGRVDINDDLDLGADGDGCECALTQPSTEVCDGADNDCDGALDAADEDFSLDTCPAIPGAQPSACAAGACAYVCAEGFVDINLDLNLDESDGCECQRTDPPTEVCDGADNDCNGDIDDEDENFTAPVCENQEGVCGGATAVCDGAPLACDEGRYFENSDAFSGLEPSLETVCDSLDNNCDGEEDELCCGEGLGDTPLVEPLEPNTVQILPAVAVADTGEVFVAWQEASSNDQTDVEDSGVVRWAIASANGAVLATDSFDSVAVEDIQPAVAFDGEAFVMVWVRESARDEIAWMRIAKDGERIAGPFDVVTDAFNTLTLRDPFLATLPSGSTVLTWSQRQACDNTDAFNCIKSMNISRQGIPEPPQEFSSSQGAIEARTPNVVLSGQGGLVSWQNGANVNWIAINDQQVPTSTLRSISLGDRNLNQLPSPSTTPSGFVIAYSNRVETVFQLHIQRLANDGSPLGEPQVLTSGPEDKTNPRLVDLPDGIALFWAEDDAIFFMKLDNEGGNPQPPRRLIDHESSFDPIAAVPIESLGMILTSAVVDPNTRDDRVNLTVLNTDGDRLCLEP